MSRWAQFGQFSRWPDLIRSQSPPLPRFATDRSKSVTSGIFVFFFCVVHYLVSCSFDLVLSYFGPVDFRVYMVLLDVSLYFVRFWWIDFSCQCTFYKIYGLVSISMFLLALLIVFNLRLLWVHFFYFVGSLSIVYLLTSSTTGSSTPFMQ